MDTFPPDVSVAIFRVSSLEGVTTPLVTRVFSQCATCLSQICCCIFPFSSVLLMLVKTHTQTHTHINVLLDHFILIVFPKAHVYIKLRKMFLKGFWKNTGEHEYLWF